MPECPSCGGETRPDDMYCPHCGRRLEEEAAGAAGGPVLTVSAMFKEAFTSLFVPSPVRQPPRDSGFTGREPSPLTPYLVAAVVLLVTGLGVSYGGRWYGYLGFTLAGYAAPVLYLVWMVRSDFYEREPLALVAYCFGWGAFSGISAGVLNALITSRYLGVGGAGFIEEPLKALGVYLVARSARVGSEFNDHLDGMVYGAAAGAGFAGLENFWYLTEMILNRSYPPLQAVLIRSMTGFMHLAWTAVAGRSLGVAKVLKGDITLTDLVPGVLVAALMHMLWNISPPLITFGLLLPFMAESLRRQVRTALDDEKRWLFQGPSPDEAGVEG